MDASTQARAVVCPSGAAITHHHQQCTPSVVRQRRPRRQPLEDLRDARREALDPAGELLLGLAELLGHAELRPGRVPWGGSAKEPFRFLCQYPGKGGVASAARVSEVLTRSSSSLGSRSRK